MFVKIWAATKWVSQSFPKVTDTKLDRFPINDNSINNGEWIKSKVGTIQDKVCSSIVGESMPDILFRQSNRLSGFCEHYTAYPCLCKVYWSWWANKQSTYCLSNTKQDDDKACDESTGVLVNLRIKGNIKGELLLRMAQSKLGIGLRPRPVILPVIVAKLKLFGEIQVIQLKRERLEKR